MISRDTIQEVMQSVNLADPMLTLDERNELRRAAVVEFLATQPSTAGVQGDEHAMILSDLSSYPAWEHENAAPQNRENRPFPYPSFPRL